MDAVPAVDVAVAGAGLSGLVAARDLEAARLTVAVVEARDRTGGRTLSASLGGQVVDLGGQWIGADHHRLAALAAELGVRSFDQYSTGTRVLEWDQRRREFSGLIPPLPALHLAELGWRVVSLERMARTVPLEDPWRARRAREWDEQSLEGWLDRRVVSAGARDALTAAAQMIFAAEPRDLSFLYFLTYLRANGSLLRLATIRGGAQARRFAGGAQQLCDRLAGELRSRPHLGEPVLAIEQDEDGVTLRTARTTRRARFAILALPPALMDRIEFTRPLPAQRAALNRQMAAGSVIKCLVAYERPFWREAGYSGEAFSTRGPVRACFDDCSPDGEHAALVAFLVGDGARALSDRAPAERRDRVVAELARWFGPEARRPIGYEDKDWLADEWSRGCYVELMPPRLLTGAGRALRAPWGRLHFAGTETAVRHVGYLEGALEAGRRAAAEVLARA